MDELNEAILAALPTIDVEDDELWTESGLPTVEAVQAATGIEDLKRKQITEAAPQFNRMNPVIEVEDLTNDEEEDDDDADNPEIIQDEEAEEVEEAEEEVLTLEKARELYAAAQDEVTAAKRNLEVASNALNAATAKAMPAATPETKQKEIMLYLQRQQEARNARAEAALEADEQPKGPAPIDAAMKPKTGFGTERPVRPLIGSVNPTE